MPLSILLRDFQTTEHLHDAGICSDIGVAQSGTIYVAVRVRELLCHLCPLIIGCRWCLRIQSCLFKQIFVPVHDIGTDLERHTIQTVICRQRIQIRRNEVLFLNISIIPDLIELSELSIIGILICRISENQRRSCICCHCCRNFIPELRGHIHFHCNIPLIRLIKFVHVLHQNLSV